jgi:hypothetical protein
LKNKDLSSLPAAPKSFRSQHFFSDPSRSLGLRERNDFRFENRVSQFPGGSRFVIDARPGIDIQRDSDTVTLLVSRDFGIDLRRFTPR